MSGPIRLPVRVEKVEGGPWWAACDANGDELGMECYGDRPEMDQIAAALNATAPGQAKCRGCKNQCMTWTVRDGRGVRCQLKHGHREGHLWPGQAAEGPPGKLTRDESTPEKAEWWRKVGEAAAGAPTLTVAEPAEATPGGERHICAVCGAAYHRGDCCPTDPGEELRLLRLLETSIRNDDDISFAQDQSSLLDQLDALRSRP